MTFPFSTPFIEVSSGARFVFQGVEDRQAVLRNQYTGVVLRVAPSQLHDSPRKKTGFRVATKKNQRSRSVQLLITRARRGRR